MKLTLKLILVVCLFSSIAFAEEGNMGGGGRTCPQGQQTCFSTEEQPETNDDSIMDFIQEYLISIFG